MKIIHKIIHKKKYYSIAEKNDYSIYFRPLTVIFNKEYFLDNNCKIYIITILK